MKTCNVTNRQLYRTSQNKEADEEFRVDEMTWRQWFNNALKRSHGLFGAGLEYYFIHQDDKIAYIKVNYHDRDLLASAVSTYISNEELVGHPLVVTILQETCDLKALEVSDDDRLWLNKEIGELEDDNSHQ